jgi:hypothetical protein
VTSQNRLAGGAEGIMACWQRNRHPVQPPAAARRRRVDMTAAKASAAATAAPAVAVSTATRTAAVPKKWLTGPENASHVTIRMAARQPAGRA